MPRSEFLDVFPRLVALAAAGLAGSALAPGAAHADAPMLKNASLTFATGDDGKDGSTVVTVTVVDAAGQILDRVLDTVIELKPDTSLTIWLQKARTETAEKLKGSRITLTVQPKADDRWEVREARLQANFDDGSVQSWHWGPFVLEARDARPASVEFSLTDDHR